MARFHVVHVLSEDSPGFEAYQEVIDTVLWGLRQIGHEATYSVNEMSPNATNIVFGANHAGNMLYSAPDNTIVYNLEQLRGHHQLNPGHPLTLYHYAAYKFQIWDYSGANIPVWNGLNPTLPVKHVPISYAPVLTSIRKAEKQDIDVLIYGAVGEKRLSVFSALAKTNMSVVFAYRMYGESRDDLISRSKIVLNISENRHGKIFEIVRASYLMANSKAVISDFSTDSFIEEDIPQGVTFVPTDLMVPACQQWIVNEQQRIQAEHRAFEVISRRDIRQFLSVALA